MGLYSPGETKVIEILLEIIVDSKSTILFRENANKEILNPSPVNSADRVFNSFPLTAKGRSKILFLTLKVFSVTGGIEKVCRILAKALFEIAVERQDNLQVFSSHDKNAFFNSAYFPAEILTGFNAKKIRFSWSSVKKGITCRMVILSHINLLPIGCVIKLFSPKTKLIIIAHGIEVWRPLVSFKRIMLYKVDLILAVSRFTKDKMKEVNRLREEKFSVLNNPLDPLLPPAPSAAATAALRHNYGFTNKEFIMLTLSRLSTTEKNKGYDKMLFAMAALVKQYPHLRYLFVGKYDSDEKSRLDKIITGYGLKGLVVFAGFVPDADLAVHYSIADVYVMPSEKEGFGISFIEALYYGVPVIAGNRDGTVDALLNGQLGTLIDPRNQQEITDAIQNVIENKKAFIPNSELLFNHFSYEVYKSKLSAILYRHLQ